MSNTLANIDDLPSFIDDLNCGDNVKILHSLKSILDLLNSHNRVNKHLHVIKESNCVKNIITLINTNTNTDVILKCLHILSILIDNELGSYIIQNGALPAIINFCKSNSDDSIFQQAIWLLGSIIDNDNTKNQLLQLNIIPFIEEKFNSTTLPGKKNCIWCVCNLFRVQLLQNESETQIIADSLWCLSYLTQQSNDDIISSILQSGICSSILKHASTNNTSITRPALRILGNFVTSTEVNTQITINNGIIPVLNSCLIRSEKKNIQKEICWTLSNITAGTVLQKQAVIDEPNLIETLLNFIETKEFDIKKEAIWCISNITHEATADQISYIVSKGCLKIILDNLIISDVRIVSILVEAILNILNAGESIIGDNPSAVHPFHSIIHEYSDGLTNMESLLKHPQESIVTSVKIIICKLYNLNEDDVDWNNYTRKSKQKSALK